ncbi:MAG: hypothetical protein JW703_04785 [Candidatus Diapherotrites archaeon]|nr:hypothetical protein [Candidatus Diapherotrites archaeon]
MVEEKSIIGIIQKMVREGAKEEEIINSLKELGVEPEQAKRLLLLGQADTFALIRGEINELVKQEIQAQGKEIKKIIEEETNEASIEAQKKVHEKASKEINELENELKRKEVNFQKSIDEKVSKSTDITTKTKDKLNELGEAVSRITMDLDELKLKGVGKKVQWISYLLVATGLGFFALDVYFFITQFQGTLSTDSLIITVVFALIGISALFVATLM